jgi:hypothetical protein
MKKTKPTKKAPSLLAVMTGKSGPQRNIVRHKRNGKSTGIRTTNAEISQRIMACATLLSRGVYRAQIHSIIAKNYGVHWRTCDNYVARARELLLSSIQKTRDELVSESYGFYTSILRDSTATNSDKLRAQERIDDLLALQAPRVAHHELSGPNGSPLAGPAAAAQVVICQWPHETADANKATVILMDNHRGDRLLDGAPAPPPPAPVSEPEPEPQAEEVELLPRGVMTGEQFLQAD